MKYIKRGIASLIPLLLVIQVLSFLVSIIVEASDKYLSAFRLQSILVILVALFFAVFFLGYATTHFKLFKRVKTYVEKKWISRIPFIGTIYSFGSEVVNTFTNDVKDNEMTVVEVDFGGFKALGVLTDKKNGIGFLISAPSPLTGVVLKLPNYKILDLTFVEAVQINSSLGRIGGDKWVSADKTDE